MRDLKEYISCGIDKVSGWCNPNLFKIITTVDGMVLEGGARGGIGEIGVHHGKFFIGLQHLRPECSALALDLFEDQDKNIDRSGCGSFDLFKENLKQFSPSPEKVDIVAVDSMGLSAEDIAGFRERHGRFSYFSVDGGHTVPIPFVTI